jgi:hypothetical protein
LFPCSKDKFSFSSSARSLPFPFLFEQKNLENILNTNKIELTPLKDSIKRTIEQYEQLKKNGKLKMEV